jgi:hypothetical protein
MIAASATKCIVAMGTFYRNYVYIRTLSCDASIKGIAAVLVTRLPGGHDAVAQNIVATEGWHILWAFIQLDPLDLDLTHLLERVRNAVLGRDQEWPQRKMLLRVLRPYGKTPPVANIGPLIKCLERFMGYVAPKET